MGRTRPKKQTLLKASETATPSKKQPSVASLFEKAQTLIVQCDYDLALKFIRRILEQEPRNADAKELLGVALLETGDLDGAKLAFQALLPPHPDAPSPSPPSAHLYLAQLNDDDPKLALQHYQAAVGIFLAQLKGKDRAADDDETNEAETKASVVRALVGQVEIWMDPSYDLCFEPDAEKTCEDLLALALQTDPGNPEALQTLASVRMSQQRPDDAKKCLEDAWAVLKDLDIDDPKLPPIPARLALVRLFLELALYTPALLVLHGIMSSDDQDVEAWYLEGWCFYLMAEQAKESGGTVDGLGWEELARDARDCLETCQVLHRNQDHPDVPLLEHVAELIAKLDGLGIAPSPVEDVEEEGVDGEDWESDDEDVEMQ